MVLRWTIVLLVLLASLASMPDENKPDNHGENRLKIVDLQYLESNSISRLVIRANLPFAYRAYARDNRTLIIETEKADTSDIAPGITIGSNSIKSISVSTSQADAEKEVTRITIRHAAGQRYGIKPKGRRLFIDFQVSGDLGSSGDDYAEGSFSEDSSYAITDEGVDRGEVEDIPAKAEPAEAERTTKRIVTNRQLSKEMTAKAIKAVSYRMSPVITYSFNDLRVVKQGADTAVIISTNKKMESRLYRVVPIGGLPRFVIDLHGARHDASPANIVGVENLFAGVRSAQFALRPYPISRIVLDMEGEREPDVIARGSDLVLLFADKSVTKPEPEEHIAENSSEIKKAENPKTKANVSEDGVEESPGNTTEASKRPEQSSDASESDTVAVTAKSEDIKEPESNTSVTEAEEDKSVKESTSENARSKEKQTNYGAADNSEAKGKAKENVDLFTEQYNTASNNSNKSRPASNTYNFSQQTQSTQADPQQQTTQVTGTEGDDFQARIITSGTQRYTGKKISLEFENINLRALILLLGQMTDKNFLVDPSVPVVNVTISLRKLPWDQALDIILENNGLAKVEEGNVIRIATRQKLTTEAEDKRRLATQRAMAIPLSQVTKPINYAKARDIANLVRRNLSSKGDVVVDVRTNTLVISDIPSKVEEALTLIEALDIPTKQVIVEARIVETTRDFINEFGLQYGFRGSANAEYGASTGLIFPNQITISGADPEISPSLLPFAVNMPANTVNSSILGSFSNINGSFILDAILTAAESDKKVRVLSRPRVSSQNNQQAEIKSGIQVPYQVIQNNTVSIQYREAMLKLTVTPHITADGTVIMDVTVDKSSLGIATPAGFSIQKREATSTILVKDGGVGVIGGVLEISDNLTEERVPVLSKIPLLGRLFRSRLNRVQNTELLIFISPKIIN